MTLINGKILFRLSRPTSSLWFFLAALVRIEIVLRLGLLVLADQIHDHRPRLVELAQPVREGSFLLVAFEVGVALPHLVVLDDDPLEQRRDGGVVGQHEAGDAVRVGEVGRFLRQSDLDGRRTPGDELCEVAFADAEEGFVDLVLQSVKSRHGET